MQAVRQAVRQLQRLPARSSLGAGQKRKMSGGASHAEEVAEANKWKNVTIVAVPLCIGLAIYDLSGSHDHHEEIPDYPYLHIRSKPFPWGDCGLFEHCGDEEEGAEEE